jgi:hypothetical protein
VVSISYLRRLEHKREFPTIDEIVLNIMPLLKNGITPERQTILNVLETVAEHAGEDRWRPNEDGSARTRVVLKASLSDQILFGTIEQVRESIVVLRHRALCGLRVTQLFELFHSFAYPTPVGAQPAEYSRH